MAKLSEEAKKAIGELGPSLVATASKDGKPNVAPKGSFRVLDDEHVIFADIASPQTIANLRENPQLSAIVFDAATRKGCRIWGKAVEILDSGNLFDTISAEYASKGMKVKHVVKVKVDEVITF